MRRLLIRPGGIGDTILSLPAMQFLRSDYTEVWVRSETLPLIRFADRVRAISSTGIDLLGLPEVQPPAALIATLRSFNSIISWYGANRPEFRDGMYSLGLPVQFFTALPDERCHVHAADFFLNQAGGHGTAVPRIDFGPAARENFAAIHPFSGSSRKNWPIERFRELASRLPIPVRWTAGPDEPLDAATRFSDLGDLARWLATARVYIGNDSGITHLAAAVGVPVVAIFGPTDPAIWSPRGNHVRAIHGPLDQITVDQVLSVVDCLR